MARKRTLGSSRVLGLLVMFLMLLGTCKTVWALPNPPLLGVDAEGKISQGSVYHLKMPPINEVLIVSQDGKIKQRCLFTVERKLSTRIEPGDVIYLRSLSDPTRTIHAYVVPEAKVVFDGTYAQAIVSPDVEEVCLTAFYKSTVVDSETSVVLKRDEKGNIPKWKPPQKRTGVALVTISARAGNLWYSPGPENNSAYTTLAGSVLDLYNNTVWLGIPDGKQASFSVKRGDEMFSWPLKNTDSLLPIQLQPGDEVTLSLDARIYTPLLIGPGVTSSGRVTEPKQVVNFVVPGKTAIGFDPASSEVYGQTLANVPLRIVQHIGSLQRFKYLTADADGKFRFKVDDDLVSIVDIFAEYEVEQKNLSKFLVFLGSYPEPTLTLTDIAKAFPDGPRKISNNTVAEGNVIKVLVNGKEVAFPDQQPYLDKKSGYTMVPIRFVGEALGATVYAGPDGIVKIDRGSTHIQLRIGEAKAIVNGVVKTLDAKVILSEKNRIMVPLRFVCETLGAKLGWDEQTCTVTIDL